MPLLALAAILFGIAAFRPALVLELAEGRRGGWLEWTSAVTAAGVNLPVALLSFYLLFETFRFGWRWADEEAARIGTRALIPHRSLLMRPIRWEEIADLRFVELPRGHTQVPTLQIDLADGGRRLIRGVDNEGGAAERFAALGRERLSAKTAA